MSSTFLSPLRASCLLFSFFNVLSQVFAQDIVCDGDVGVHPDLQWLPTMQRALCDPGNAGCASQQSTESSTDSTGAPMPISCVLELPISNGTGLTASRQQPAPAAGQPAPDLTNCAEKAQAIVDKCFNNKDVQYADTKGTTSGSWSSAPTEPGAASGGESYSIEWKKADEFKIAGAPFDGSLVVGPDGYLGGDGDEDEYIYGPRHYCPNGEGTDPCVDIAEDCYVIAPPALQGQDPNAANAQGSLTPICE